MNLSGRLNEAGIAGDIKVLRDTNPHFAEFLRILQVHQAQLLATTMKSGCDAAQANELRYRAGGIDDVLTAVGNLK